MKTILTAPKLLMNEAGQMGREPGGCELGGRNEKELLSIIDQLKNVLNFQHSLKHIAEK